jgi:hypothetical protein
MSLIAHQGEIHRKEIALLMPKTMDETMEEQEQAEDNKTLNQAPDLNEEQRREKRFNEWGDQFDIWLIRAAKKQREIECILSSDLAGVTQKGNVLQGVPLRVDKNQVQFLVKEEEIWIDRSLLVTAKHLPLAEPV